MIKCSMFNIHKNFRIFIIWLKDFSHEIPPRKRIFKAQIVFQVLIHKGDTFMNYKIKD
jgi:hypothetical protein